MKILGFLIQKEFIQIRRNRFLPRLIVMFPIMIMCVIPWITNLEVKNITVTVVDNDRSPLSSRLTGRIAASQYFVFKGVSPSYGEAMRAIEDSKADIVAVIPRHYGRDIDRGETPEVLIAANSVNGTKGSMGAAYLTNIVSDNAREALHQPTTMRQMITELNLYNPHLDYKVFMIPALMAMLVVLVCGFLPALNIVSEKETGTIEQMNVTPVGKGVFILSKLVPYWLIGMLIMTVCLLLSWAVYGITPSGSIALIYLLAMLLALSFSAIGLIVSNHSETMQQAMFVMWFVMVCMLLLSGLFTPISSMPDWAQYITLANPMRYFIDAVRTVFVRGGGMTDVASQLMTLTGFAVMLGLWAVASYRKNK